MFQSDVGGYNISKNMQQFSIDGGTKEYQANICNQSRLNFSLLDGTSGNGSAANCSNEEYFMYEDMDDPFKYTHIRATFIVLYSIVFVCCFVGNLFVIIVVLKHRRMRTITNFFLANLAVADLCVGIFCVLPNLSLYLSPYWVLGKAMCKVYYFVQASSYTASITILTVISIERYFAIIYPIRSKQMTTMCILRITVVVVWCISAASGLPFLITYSTIDLNGHAGETLTYCFMSPHWQVNMKAYVVVSFLLWYLMPLGLMTVMYTRISVVLWQTSRGDQNRKAGGSCGSYNLHYVLKKKKSSLKSNRLDLNVPRKEPLDTENKSKSMASARFGNAARPGQNVREGGEEAGSATEQQKLMDSSDYSSPYESPAPAQSLVGEESPEDTSECCANIDYEDDWPGKRQHHQNIPMSILISKSGKGSPKSPYKMNGRSSDNQSVNIQIVQGKGTKPLKATSTSGPRRKEKKAENNPLLARRRVIRLLIAVICSFAVCVLPYHVRTIWQTYSEPRITFSQALIPPITFVIFYLNSGLNPILYAFLSDRFRQCLTEVFTCRDNRKSRQSQISFTSKTVNSTVQY